MERRYSEFVFVWDCLVRRYPFRILPALPPKRIGREFFDMSLNLFIDVWRSSGRQLPRATPVSMELTDALAYADVSILVAV